MTESEFSFFIVGEFLYVVAAACANWIKRLFDAAGATGFYLSCFSIFFIVKYLIRPLVGSSITSGRSDLAQKRKSDDDV